VTDESSEQQDRDRVQVQDHVQHVRSSHALPLVVGVTGFVIYHYRVK
jgi:hypothetical protein